MHEFDYLSYTVTRVPWSLEEKLEVNAWKHVHSVSQTNVIFFTGKCPYIQNALISSEAV